MTTPRSPRTEAGKADHDLAWADGDASPVSHDSAREGCEGCAFIARIEAEAAAPRSPRTEADPWEALRLDIEDAMVRGEWGQSADDADALIARHRPAIEAEAAAPRSDEMEESGWWHHDTCIDLHDEDHNCLDDGGSIIGWRVFIPANADGRLQAAKDRVVGAVAALDQVATWSALNRPEYPSLRAALDDYYAEYARLRENTDA